MNPDDKPTSYPPSATDDKVVGFPKEADITPEERARRLKAEVERLASCRRSSGSCTSTRGVAEKHGVSFAAMKEMIEATIKANEKRAREDKAEDRRREQRAEKKQSKDRREEDRTRREQERARREEARAQREEERKSKARVKEFEAIAKLPRVEHEMRLAELGKRLVKTSNCCMMSSRPLLFLTMIPKSSRGRSRSPPKTC